MLQTGEVYLMAGPHDKETAAQGYVESLASSEAYALLQTNPEAQLVDVRTRAEWSFVGLPDLDALGRQPLLAEWQQFPSMAVDPAFAQKVGDTLTEAGATKETPLLFLCRSGGRSLAAARAMAAAGFSACINVSDGFEGDMDANRQRGRVNGWKAAGLPWVQS